MTQPYRYFAFISYSRRDSKVAAWLQKHLEWFRFPVKLVPEDRRPPNDRYVRPVYRDKTNLEVTDEHYWTNIRRALEESRYLIILCSPQSAKSEPVNMEVEHFLKTHGGDARLIVPVIVSGNVTSTETDAALCPALSTLGSSLITRNLPTMVPDEVETGIAAAVTHLRTRVLGFAPDAWVSGVTSLLAYLLNIDSKSFADHIQRQERRRVMWNRALAVIFALLALLAWHQRGVAVEAKRDVEKANAVIAEKNEINLKNLHEASMSDYSVALQRIEQDKRWTEGVAHLARSLDWDPGNGLAAARLYSTIGFKALEKSDNLRQLLLHGSVVWSANFNPDGTRVVTASHDKSARMWDVATGMPLGEPMSHRFQVLMASFSPDGTRIVTASGDVSDRRKDGEAGLWDVATGSELGQPMRHEAWVDSASFSPDGTRVVTACRDNTARLWDAATGEPLGEPMRHQDSIESVSFSPDGTRVVTASHDKSARLWDVATGMPLGEPMRHQHWIKSVDYSPDGTRIVTASLDNTARLWDAAPGEPLGVPMRHESMVIAASFSPDGTRVVTANLDNTARLWVAATGKPIGEPMRHEGLVNSASFSPDGTRVVTASYDVQTAQLWDAATGKPLGESMRHEDSVEAASFSPDSTLVITASRDKTARLWDAATGKPVGEPMRHEGSVESASFSPDGKRVVTVSIGNNAWLWDAITGQPIGEPMRHEDSVLSASFSPDGTRIVTASGANGDFSNTGQARIWDTATGKPVGELMSHGLPVLSANFSPDGAQIVTASEDGTARLWIAATGKPLGEPMVHEDGVWSARFSPDGTRIVTASEDGTARLWIATTGKPLGEPMLHLDNVHYANFSPDGTRILTASRDGTTRLWEVSSLLHLPAETPEWVRNWSSAVAGWKFDADGVMQPMPGEERIKILHTPREGDDSWSRLARWLATDPTKRTIHPDSQHTCREIAERERDFGSKESLESALRYDPTVPLARLLLAKFEENPQRAAFMRDYDLKRLPDDPALWSRAAQSLNQQKDDSRTSSALDKLTMLAPDQARVLRKEFGL